MNVFTFLDLRSALINNITLEEGNFFHVVDHLTHARFTMDPNTGNILLGGQYFGTTEDLHKLKVLLIEMDKDVNPTHCTIELFSD